MKNIDWVRISLICTMGAIILALILRYDQFITQKADAAYKLQQKAADTTKNNVELIDNTIEQSISTANSANSAKNTKNAETTKNFSSEFDVEAPTTNKVNANIDTSVSESDNSNLITINTDVFEVIINKIGGDIISLKLLQHNQRLNYQSPVQLLTKSNNQTFIAQSGIINIDRFGRPKYKTQQNIYQLTDDKLVVDLFSSYENIDFTKRYIFNRSSYSIAIEYIISNNSSDVFNADLTVQFRRNEYDPQVNESMGMAAFVGPAITTDEQRYKRFDFEDLEKNPFKLEQTNGWVAMVQRYFTTAWIADSRAPIKYSLRQSKANNGLFLFGYTQRGSAIAPKQTAILKTQIYAGPKHQYTLAKLGSNLDLTVDYGWLWWIAQPLFDLLSFFHNGTLNIFSYSLDIFSGFNNWGVAIILLTLLVKLVFFRLSATSYKSMAKMRKLQPKMAILKDRYGSDRQKMSQETMKLYKKEKVNPLGGCLPMLIQMPIFLALYWVLLESVEIRHAPFMLWITDLSTRDPLFILPILMGASMYIQFQLNPTPPDPMQAKVMKFMPIFLTLIFLFMPSGLVLYWTVNNILSIAQQWYITKKLNA